MILTKIPEGYSEIAMKQFLEEHWGRVLEIYTVKDFQDDLIQYKELTVIANAYKE